MSAAPIHGTSGGGHAGHDGPDDDELERQLEYLEVDQSMASARGALIPYTVLLVLLLALMLPYSPWAPSLLWASGFACYILARRHLGRRYAALSVNARKAQLRRLHRTLLATSLVFGLLWGAAFWIAFPGSPEAVKLTWTLAAVTMIAGAPRLLTMPQFMVLTATVLLGVLPAWLVWGGRLGALAAGVLALLAGLFVVMARDFHRGLRAKFELQLRNEHLVRELARQNATLQQMAQARTLLLATASHDLRQPVHALGLLMENLRHSHEPQPLHRRLGAATDCVNLLSDMLANLLDFTHLDAGGLPATPRAVALQNLFDEAVRTFTPLAWRKGLVLRVEPTSLVARTDAHLLRRMLFNLVSNAIKYTREGTVRVHAGLEDNGRIVLHVEDTGIGIAPDRLDEIFNDYVTVDATQPSPHPDSGLGLGLGIVRRCAERLGQPVEVHSRPGQGSRFSIHLGPAVPADQAHPFAASPHRPLDGVVAIVENDPVVLEGLSDMLRGWGCHPVAGTTSTQVMALLNQARLTPRLILSDLHLDVSHSGFDAIDALRRGTGADHLPAVMLTGDIDPALLQTAQAQRIRLEHKPLLPNRLREVLDTLLAPG